MDKEAHGSIATYITGFVLSVVMTLTAYFAVTNKALEGSTLGLVLGGLAIAQLLVQLIFFLHLGRETKPRWKLVMFFSMVVVVAIVVIGSLWVMYNLDYHMMPAHEVEKTIMEEEAIQR